MDRFRVLFKAAVALGALAFLVSYDPAAEPSGRRLLTLDDMFALRDVDDPQVSPEGDWVAYTVRVADRDEDKSDTDLWMTRWDGSRSVRLTSDKGKEHTPRWSPDGQYLAFLSSRGVEEEVDQLWILNRQGGEAELFTRFKGEVSDYEWSPDSKRLVLVAQDPEPDAAAAEKEKGKNKEKKPRPIVIDRFQFKQDEEGYLRHQRRHLYLFDLATRADTLLTPGDFDELLPAWSPDGKSLAFVSKRGPDPDRHDNWDLFLVEAREGAAPRQLTQNDIPDGDPSWDSRPAWSPDGKSIAYLQGGPQKLIYYAVHQLAVIPTAGGPPRLPAADLDRNMDHPVWSADGRSIYFLLEDDRAKQVARVPAAGGKVERVLAGERVVSALAMGPGGKIAILASTPQAPPEVFALEGTTPRPLSRQNDELLAGIELGVVEGISFKSKDGTTVNGLVVKPPRYQAGRKVPTLLRIHGGPVDQFGYEFDFEWQLFAARGYAVVGANPRGSSGRGEAFSKAIYADWGNKDAQDVLAAVDYVVREGIADPQRLGLGGWSYGGMLTNYTIAQDTRFKAATSGASISNILAGYGTDQYIREYEAELGSPWKNTGVWTRLSFPFLHADRIVTPTLFLCGQADFNVPLLNSEQMYQALHALGRDTQLVIYPREYHGLRRPSFKRDRLERYLTWYDKYLKPGA
jgi:dipeptidyl aminopeptidase/acylaminoacyl peptidase